VQEEKKKEVQEEAAHRNGLGFSPNENRWLNITAPILSRFNI